MYTVLYARYSLSWELGPAATCKGGVHREEGWPGATGAAQLLTPSQSVPSGWSCYAPGEFVFL